MSPGSFEDPERRQREEFEAVRDDALHDVMTVGDAQLREPIERFLADYERIAALSGPEFSDAVSDAMGALDTELEAAYAAVQERHDRQLREGFEAVCRKMADLLQAQRDLDSNIATNDETPYRRQTQLREKAIALLADADRIRALSGDDFAREAASAIESFNSHELQAAKLEIYANAAAGPFRRWCLQLVGRFSR